MDTERVLSLPTDDTRSVAELNALLDEMFAEGDALKRDLYPEWDANIRYLENRSGMDQWPAPRRGNLVTMTYNNLMRLVVQEAASVADMKPVYTVESSQEIYKPAAGILGQILTSAWERHGHALLIPRAVIDLAVFAKAFWKTVWDPSLLWGSGDFVHQRVDPDEVYVDNCTSLADASFICHRQVRPLWWVKSRFPNAAHLMKPDDIVEQRPSTPYASYTVRPRSWKTQAAVERVLVEEWLIRDPSPISEVEPDVPKYPAGRLITRVGAAAKVIAQDIPYPWIDPWPGPWAEMSSVGVRGFWPPQELTQLRSLQEFLNLLLSLVGDEAKRMSPGLWIVDQNAIRPEGERTLLQETGGIVKKKEGTEVRRELYQGPSAGNLALLQSVNQMMEYLAGIQDAARVPRGIVSGAGLESVQQAAQSIVRLRVMEITHALRQAGWQALARVLQFYTDRRIFLLTGADGRMLRMIYDPVELGLTDRAEELIKRFVLQVQTTTEMAVSKEKGYALHTALYGMGAIDRKALLDALEYPGRDEILSRIERAAQLGMDTASAGPTPRGRGVKVIEQMLRGPGGGPGT